MPYRVKEIFATLQGEGAFAGTAATFVRMAGCNLWSGHDADRARDAARHGAACPAWCDTDFVGGELLDAGAIVERCLAAGPARTVVVTGGEPALQLDDALCRALQAAGLRVAVETSGTVRLRCAPDWIAISPKRLDDAWIEKRADELKVIVPAYDPDAVLRAFAAGDGPRRATPELFVQPQDGAPGAVEHAVAYVRAHPRWRLSLQTHKLLGLP